MEKCTFDFFKRTRDRAVVLSDSEKDEFLSLLLSSVVSAIDKLLLYAPVHVGHGLVGYSDKIY